MEKYVELCKKFNLILYRKKGPVNTLNDNMAKVVKILDLQRANMLGRPLKEAILEDKKPSKIMDSINAINDNLTEQKKIINNFRKDDIIFKSKFKVIQGELSKKATMIIKSSGNAEFRKLASYLVNARNQIGDNEHLIDSKEIMLNNQNEIFKKQIFINLKDMPSMFKDPIKNITPVRNIAASASALSKEVAKELPLTTGDVDSYDHIEKAETTLSKIPKLKFA